MKDINLVIRFLKEDKNFFCFYRFLINQNCFESYFDNLIKEHISWRWSSKKQECIINHLKRETKGGLIIGAFSWSETKEGFSYWHKIHCLWNEYNKK